MQRRDLLKNLGTAGATTIAVTGAASASRSAEPAVDVEVDVSDVEGDVTLAALLDDEQLAMLPDDVDPTRRGMTIDADTETVDPTACNCIVCEENYPEWCLCSRCCWEVC